MNKEIEIRKMIIENWSGTLAAIMSHPVTSVAILFEDTKTNLLFAIQMQSSHQMVAQHSDILDFGFTELTATWSRHRYHPVKKNAQSNELQKSHSVHETRQNFKCSYMLRSSAQ